MAFFNGGGGGGRRTGGGGRGGGYPGGRRGRSNPARAALAATAAHGSVSPMQGLPALEAQFSHTANDMCSALLDLNVPTKQILAIWEEVLAMRATILASYGVVSQGNVGNAAMSRATAAAATTAAAVRPQQHSQTEDWKSKLDALLSKKVRRSLTKGEVTYNITEHPLPPGLAVSGRLGGGPITGYVAECVSPLLIDIYHGMEPVTTKKLAEHAAARAAISAEFPGDAATGPMMSRGNRPRHAVPSHSQAFISRLGSSGGGGGSRKRQRSSDGYHQAPAAGGAAQADDEKSRLTHAAQYLLGRPLQKGDVAYDTRQLDEGGPDEGGYISVVCIPSFDPHTTFESKPSENRKLAENGAAAQALHTLHDIIEIAAEEHRMKKARLKAEKDMAFQAKLAAKGTDAQSPTFGSPPFAA